MPPFLAPPSRDVHMDAAAPPAGLVPAGLDDAAFDDKPILAEGAGSPANIGNQVGPPGVPADNQAGTDVEPEAFDDLPILAEVPVLAHGIASTGNSHKLDGGTPAPTRHAVLIAGTGASHHSAADVPVLAHQPGPIASTGTRGELAVDDVSIEKLKPVASTGSHVGWRVERFGPPAKDNKGRYWQWRRGSGKGRASAYGGKVISEASEYWQYRRASTGRHA